MNSQSLICITGTTGSGKNSLGVLVAERLDAEIVSLDSMKVYRGMDLGTAKPSKEELGRVRHHLIDILQPDEHMDLRRFLAAADAAIEDIQERGRRVVCVGGTAMYLAGLLYGVMDGPSRDDEFRRALQAERDLIGLPALHNRLREIDEASAERIDPHDYQRIERALEIHALTGQPASALRQDWFQSPRRASRIYVLTWPRDILRQRIFDRVDEMFEEGWVDEVRRLHDAGGLGPEAAQALGYREILRQLESGTEPDEALRERIKTKTWQFARRQLTWMKKFSDAETITRHVGDELKSYADFIAEQT